MVVLQHSQIVTQRTKRMWTIILLPPAFPDTSQENKLAVNQVSFNILTRTENHFQNHFLLLNKFHCPKLEFNLNKYIKIK